MVDFQQWNELKRKILFALRDLQCWDELTEGDGDEINWVLNDDETPCATYEHLENKLSVSRARLKIEVIEMRNAGLIELTPTVNNDYMPSGSGWILTSKGVALINQLSKQ